MATRVPSAACAASYTDPIPPSPSKRRRRYFPLMTLPISITQYPRLFASGASGASAMVHRFPFDGAQSDGRLLRPTQRTAPSRRARSSIEFVCAEALIPAEEGAAILLQLAERGIVIFR